MLDAYTTVAEEYYDLVAHPTCNNFRYLSEQFLGATLLELWSEMAAEQPALEVGAGRSVVAPLLKRLGASLSHLTLQDLSAAMLRHSFEWFEQAHSLVGDARSVALANSSQALVVSSLGDPYDDEAFLDEVRRLLMGGGHFLITTPSEAWASTFREHANHRDAEFVLRNGISHYVPSITWDPGEYISMVEARGFGLREFKAFQASDVDGPLSPKLRVDGYEGPVLDGYWFQKDRS